MKSYKFESAAYLRASKGHFAHGIPEEVPKKLFWRKGKRAICAGDWRRRPLCFVATLTYFSWQYYYVLLRVT